MPEPLRGILKTPAKKIIQYTSKARLRAVRFTDDGESPPRSGQRRASYVQPIGGDASSSRLPLPRLPQDIADPVVHRGKGGSRFDPRDSSTNRRPKAEDWFDEEIPYKPPRRSCKLRRRGVIQDAPSMHDSEKPPKDFNMKSLQRMIRSIDAIQSREASSQLDRIPTLAKGKWKASDLPKMGTSASSQSTLSDNVRRTARTKMPNLIKPSIPDHKLLDDEPDEPDTTVPLASSAPKNAAAAVADPAPKDVVMAATPEAVATGVTVPKDVAMSVDTSTPRPSQPPITSFFAQTRAANSATDAAQTSASKAAPTPAPAPTPSLMSTRPFSTPTADPDLVGSPLVSVRKTASSMPPPITLPVLPSTLGTPNNVPSSAVPPTDPKVPSPLPASTPGPQSASGFVLARPTGFGISNPPTLPLPTSVSGAPQTQTPSVPTPHPALGSAFSTKPLNALQSTEGLDAPPPSISRISQQPAPAVPSTKSTGFAFTSAQNAPLQLPQLALNIQQPQMQHASSGATWLDQALSLTNQIAAINPPPSILPLALVSTNVVAAKKPLPPPKERKELEAGDENASGSFYGALDDASRRRGPAKRKPLAVKTTPSPGGSLAAPKRGLKTEPKKIAKKTPAISPLNISTRQRTAEQRPQPRVDMPESAEQLVKGYVSVHSKPGKEGHTYIKKLVSDFSSMHPEMQPERQPIVVSPPQGSLARSQRQEAPVSPPRTGYSTSAVYLDQSASCTPESTSVPAPARGSKCPTPPTSDKASQPSSRRLQRIQSTSTLADEAFVRDFLDTPDPDFELDLNDILNINAFGASVSNANRAGAPAEAAAGALVEASSAVGFALGRTVAAVARLLA